METSTVEYTGVKVFSATKARERDGLGDAVTRWLRDTGVTVTDVKIRQSSDDQFHCLSIIVFYT